MVVFIIRRYINSLIICICLCANYVRENLPDDYPHKNNSSKINRTIENLIINFANTSKNKSRDNMNKKEVIFVLLNEFADWEGAYIATCLNIGVKPGSPVNYTVKTMSVTKDPIMSIGGFKVLPDYDLNDMPTDHAGLVLIGGMHWFSLEAAQIVPLVEKAIEDNKLVAGICNASVFLGAHGILNNVKHTSNGLDYLKQYAGEKYTGEANYINEQAVRDGNIVTANGTSPLEFCREVLYVLEAATPEIIEESYQYYTNGLSPK